MPSDAFNEDASTTASIHSHPSPSPASCFPRILPRYTPLNGATRAGALVKNQYMFDAKRLKQTLFFWKILQTYVHCLLKSSFAFAKITRCVLTHAVCQSVIAFYK